MPATRIAAVSRIDGVVGGRHVEPDRREPTDDRADRKEDRDEDQPHDERAPDGLALDLQVVGGLAVRDEPLERLARPPARRVRLADQAVHDLPVPERDVAEVSQQDAG